MADELISLSPDEHTAFSSRWRRTPQGSLIAAWAGQSLFFRFHGSQLRLQFGASTLRKDPDNGGTPMIVVHVWKQYAVRLDGPPDEAQTCDSLAPNALISIISEKEAISAIVEITLIDWASEIEITNLLVDQHAKVEPYAPTPATGNCRLLFIGDSLSVGLAPPADADTPPAMPLGCLNAFPYICRDLLNAPSSQRRVTVDLVAFPGWPFVGFAGDASGPGGPGLQKKIWEYSPWSFNQDWLPSTSEEPDGIVLALGTNDDCLPGMTAELFSKAVIEFLERFLSAFESGKSKKIYVIPPWIDFADPPQALATSFASEAFPAIKSAFPVLEFHYCDIVGVVTSSDVIDSIHPTRHGHELLGRELAQVIQKSGFL